MKIYTRTGDKGETALLGGQRVAKNDPRIEACGSVDELNAAIGLAISQLTKQAELLEAPLLQIQHQLFDIGAELAGITDGQTVRMKLPKVTATKVAWLETTIDRWSTDLIPLRQFVLPGGSLAASSLHLARTIARRAERAVLSVTGNYNVNPELIKYLNRLSDLLFTAARVANHLVDQPDINWQKDLSA